MNTYQAPVEGLENYKLVLGAGQWTKFQGQLLAGAVHRAASSLNLVEAGWSIADRVLDASSSLMAQGCVKYGETVIRIVATPDDLHLTPEGTFWLQAASDSFSCWDNEDDAIYDAL